MQNKTFTTLLLSMAALPVMAQIDTTRVYDINEVVVTGTRNTTDVRHLPLTITSIGRDRLTERYTQSILPTLTEQTPGLFTTSRGVLGYGVSTGGAGSMKIRGIGSGAELLVLIDGQPQYAGLMGHPIPDVYNTLMAEKVEVLRGPASLFYGSNAMAGVVNIVTRQMNQDGSKTNIGLSGGSYGTLEATASNRYARGKFSSFVGANYQRTDGHRPYSAFENMAGFLKLGYALNDHWKLNGDLNLTHFNAENPGPDTAPMIDNVAHITRGLASVSLNNDYGHTNGSLRAYFDWGHHNINDGHTAAQPAKTYLYLHNDYIGGISFYQSASLFAGNRLTFGLDWQHFGGEAYNSALADGTRTNLIKDKDGKLVDSTSQDEFAGYVDFRQELASWLSAQVGLRVDHHSMAGTELVPQAGLSFHLNANQDLKALVSKGFRNPIIREMYMFPPSNTELEPERMMNYELAYTYRLNGRGHVGANLFYIKGDNLITTVFSQEVGHKLNVNSGEFTNYGFELSADYRFSSHWSVNGNYSFLHMKNILAEAPESKFYAGVNYTRGKFALAAGLQQIDGLYLTASEDGPKESYILLNASLTYKVSPVAHLYVKGDNLLAQKYYTYQGFYMPRATFMGGINLNF